jgi:hypothetical protein
VKKRVTFFGRETSIICQNDNGPCPLIGIGTPSCFDYVSHFPEALSPRFVRCHGQGCPPKSGARQHPAPPCDGTTTATGWGTGSARAHPQHTLWLSSPPVHNRRVRGDFTRIT